MRRVFFAILLLFISLPVLAGGTAAVTDSARILLINPSQGDLDSMIRMIESGTIPLARPLLTAVYGAQVERPVESIRDRIAARGLPWVQVEVIAGDLEPETLFGENPCTPAFRRLFARSDAALFFGGDDLPAACYGRETSLLTFLDAPQRHYFELSFLFHLLGGSQNPAFTPLLEARPGYVVRGFCLGMQTMNVAAGGTMIQDIPSEIYKLRSIEAYIALPEGQRHDNYWPRLDPHGNYFWCHFQPIRFVAKGFFTRELRRGRDEHPAVCSSHHQAVGKLGRDLEVAATSLDGKVVEALTHQRYKNVLGVQFHPEPGAIYEEEGGGHTTSPADTALVTLHEQIRRQGSLEFHLAFWRQFAALLQPAE
ncbi:MAG TPA: gamma-glutamyl-gamma-aminobutyrate hydrolase family protein [bacterium]|nr:gamma-glutamyl-gamma-aminobutyrate hydrolase family protein [bacterium]HPR88224.1 gamma-glutamyl-gamma-aminobutyrate hydrolase family protein [bacterium]